MENISLIIKIWTAIVSFCFEGYIDMNRQSSRPKDIGFIITRPIFNLLRENQTINGILALINSIIILSCKGYVVYIFMTDETSLLPNRILWLMSIRNISGVLTRYPIPEDFECVDSKYDIPPKGGNFFYMFSAHTYILTSVALHVIYETNYMPIYFSITGFLLLYLFQSIRLLATRGHYSNDIFLGSILSYTVFHMYKAQQCIT